MGIITVIWCVLLKKVHFHITLLDMNFFQTPDCTSKLVKKLYDPKFPFARTKTKAIIVNVISPFIFDNMLHSFGNINM
ncbi:hypothetical protein X975_05531, partial [Stegodyphus mimosarum]